MLNELRKDYFLDRWVIISAGRGKRPTDFKKDAQTTGVDSLCFFCPGNEHTTPPEISRVEEDGRWVIRIFPNKFPAVTMEDGEKTDNLMPARGMHEVVVETPEHEKSLGDVSASRMAKVLEVYSERVNAMLSQPGIEYALVFKNHGKSAGASLAHTHTQIVSLPIIPKLVGEEVKAAREYKNKKGACPLCEAIKSESAGPRSTYEDEYAAAFTPYASRSPFEAWILPKRHVRQLDELTKPERDSIATALVKTLSTLKSGLNDPPYNFYIHASPAKEDLHLHIEIMPKLSNWAGLELGSEIVINTMPPETAANFYNGK